MFESQWFSRNGLILFGAIYSFLWLPVIDGQLLYINSAVYKFIVGYSVPVSLESPGLGLGWLVNLQGLYRLPDNITYFQPYKVLQKRSAFNHFDRPMVYRALANFFNRYGFEGSECVSRIICEMASVFTENDLPWRNEGRSEITLEHSLLTILFTPNYRAETRYSNAYIGGQNGNDNCSYNYNCNFTIGHLRDLWLSTRT